MSERTENPYRVLGPKVPPLLARQTLLQQIESRLAGEDPEHISVIGPAMYGKRVLLHELARRHAEQDSGFLTAVYVDFRSASPGDDEQLREHVAGAMRSALNKARPELAEYFDLDGVRPKERMQAVIQELASSGDRLLVILDGFDRALANPAITHDIWDNLRSLARQPVVRYVTGSRRALRELCRTAESRAADLWEIFAGAPLIVGRFDESDWDALLEPFAASGSPIDSASRAAIADWTGGIPLLVSAMLSELYQKAGSDGVPVDDVERVGEQILEHRRELLDALWEDCTAEMKTDLADLSSRELRLAEIPQRRLRELEQRGLVQRQGKRIRSACRLMNRFAAGEATEVDSLQRLFGENSRFEHNVRALLEMRLAQLPDTDRALRGYVEQSIRHIHPEPRHAIVWVRSIVDRAFDLIWQHELKDGVTIPRAWREEWERAGLRNPPDDGTGRLPGERGRQLRLLRYATGTGLRGQTIRRVTRDISRPTALLLEHLQSVGNFGQHQDDTVEPPFAVSVCLTAIALCHGLSADLKERG